MFLNHRIQKYISLVLLAAFCLTTLGLPIKALAQIKDPFAGLDDKDIPISEERVGTASREQPKKDIGKNTGLVGVGDVTRGSEAAIIQSDQQKKEAIGEIAGSIQKGEDLCKDIKGSVGQVALQIGVKVAGEALKAFAKEGAKRLGKFVGNNALDALNAYIPSSKEAIKKMGKMFGFGKKGAQKVEISKGGPLEDLQKKIINKECLIKPFVRAASSMMIRTLTRNVVGWIQGYDPETGESNVGFVKSFKQSMKQELNFASGQFLNKLTGVDLCGGVGFQRFLKIRMQVPSSSYTDDYQGLSRQLGCTATDIVKQTRYDYQNLRNNFAGGWPSLLRHSLEPQNNPYGAYMIALDARVQAETSAQEQFEKGFLAGGGFLGFNTEESYNCRPIPDQVTIDYLNGLKKSSDQLSKDELKEAKKAFGYKDDSGGKWSQCDIRKVTRTPGQTAAYLLNKTIGQGLDQATTATEMDNLIASTINATINRLIGGSGGKKAKGIFEDSPNDGLALAIDRLAKRTGEEDTKTIDIPILKLIAKADITLSYLDNAILLPTLNNMAANLAPVGTEQLFPGQISPGQEQAPSEFTYQGTVRELRESALGASQTGHLFAQTDFATYGDSFRQKQQIQSIKTKLIQKLAEILESGINIQSSIAALGISSLERELDSAIASIPVSSGIELYGTVEKNLSGVFIAAHQSADDASRKVLAMNALNLRDLPAVSGNQAAQNKIENLAASLNGHKNILENISARFDPGKMKDMDLEEITAFATGTPAQNDLRQIMERSLAVDDNIYTLLSESLAIPKTEFTATTTPTQIGSGQEREQQKGSDTGFFTPTPGFESGGFESGGGFSSGGGF